MKKTALTALIYLSLCLPLFANRFFDFSGYYSAGNAVLSWDYDPLVNVKIQRLYKRDFYATNHAWVADILPGIKIHNDPDPNPNFFYYYKLVFVLSNGSETDPSQEVEISTNKTLEKYDLIRFVDNTLKLSSPGTKIQFTYGIPVKGMAEVAILNVNREVVKVILPAGNRDKDADLGTFLGTWDGSNMDGKPVQPGIYIIVVNTAGGREAKRVVVKP